MIYGITYEGTCQAVGECTKNDEYMSDNEPICRDLICGTQCCVKSLLLQSQNHFILSITNWVDAKMLGNAATQKKKNWQWTQDVKLMHQTVVLECCMNKTNGNINLFCDAVFHPDSTDPLVFQMETHDDMFHYIYADKDENDDLCHITAV